MGHIDPSHAKQARNCGACGADEPGDQTGAPQGPNVTHTAFDAHDWDGQDISQAVDREELTFEQGETIMRLRAQAY